MMSSQNAFPEEDLPLISLLPITTGSSEENIPFSSNHEN